MGERRGPGSGAPVPGRRVSSIDHLFDWLPADRPAEGERLQKVLARVGFGSRRVCEELIEHGRVTVNGEVAELGRRVDLEHDSVAVNGEQIGIAAGLVHYLLNKPAGVVTTARDPEGRPTVTEFVPGEPRVFPVGRLDADSEGLLVLTNDGELTHRLTHPSFGVEKEYLAHVDGSVGAAALRRLRQGVELDDGMTAPATVSSPTPGLVHLTIHEGRNRQVRRMLAEVGHPVRRLVRVRIGPLSDPRLRPGTWRPLEPDEVRALSGAAGPAPRPRRDPRAAGGEPTAGHRGSGAAGPPGPRTGSSRRRERR